jgi:hypothetical protein
MSTLSNNENIYVGYIQLKPGVYYYRSNSKGQELGELGYFVNHIVSSGKYWGKGQSALFTKMSRNSEAFKKISGEKSDDRIIEYDKTKGFITFGGNDICSRVPEFCDENGKVNENMFTMVDSSDSNGYDFYYVVTKGGRKHRNKTKRRKIKLSKKLKKRRSTKKH